ncbi:transposon Ty3-I Gag-Pol polyprotein [Trichonephila clavipes]|nr:transposon Ty3-I Gag-Pol polyprotein [Trichonephila clavipes]
MTEWFMKEGLIALNYECPKCNEQMGLYERQSAILVGFEWRCQMGIFNHYFAEYTSGNLADKRTPVLKHALYSPDLAQRIWQRSHGHSLSDEDFKAVKDQDSEKISSKKGQTIETYVTQLKTLASTGEFAEQENGLIRDRIVLGIKNSGLQERILRKNNLNIEKTIEIVRAAKASREQIRNMKYDTATINFVKENQIKPKTQYNCKKCGRKHKPRECPMFGKICAKYKKKNHFATKCFLSTKNIHKMNVSENELEIGITQECGCVGFNGPDGRQGCVLPRTVESNQGGRFDSNESAADSFPSGAVGFKSWSARILGAFSLLRLPEKTSSWEANSLPEVALRRSYHLR